MSDKNAMALVHSTESFGSVDGPGVRFIIFLQKTADSAKDFPAKRPL